MNPHSDPNHRPDPLLAELEACEFLRIRPRQLYAWRRQGLIPFIRISRSVRYRRSELEAALDVMSVGGFTLKSSAPATEQPEALSDSRA
jgi:DNA-binding transcriptional MerR regulator